MKMIEIKDWCDANITPMAWQRVAMKLLNHFKDKGFSLSQLQNPSSDLVLDSKDVNAIDEALNELYEKSLPVSLKI